MYKPEEKLDIKTEINRYAKNNYSKKDVIAHLKKDGFSTEEINRNITNEFDKLDRNYFDNLFCFLPSLSAILVAAFYLFSFYSSEQNFFQNLIVVIGVLGIIGVFYYYFKKNKTSVIMAMFLFGLTAMYLIYLYFINSQNEQNYFSSSYLIVIVLILIYLILENYKVFIKKSK